MNRFFILAILLTSSILKGQDMVKGLPDDIEQKTIVFLLHSSLEVKTDVLDKASAEYIIERQENHNKVLKEFNTELETAAKKYPFKYKLASINDLAAFKSEDVYVLESEVYDNKHLHGQPNEDELIIFSYYIKDEKHNKTYHVFEMDEMKVYDAKLLIKRLNRQLKKQKPDAFN